MYGEEYKRDHYWEYKRQEYLDSHPEPVYMWCKDCKETVAVDITQEYEYMDGRSYPTITYFECPVNKKHEVEDVRKCPICGEDMGESDEFCQDCYNEANQRLTHMRDEMCLTQDQFEDIVANVMGW